jgi:hypothetical protein
MKSGNIYIDKKPSTLISSKFYAIITFIIILVIVIFKYAFKDGKLICDDYVFNSYLYLLLSQSIIFFIIIMHEHTKFYSSILKIYKNDNLLLPISLIIIQLYIIYLLKNNIKNTSHNNIIKIHILWLFLTILVGLFLIPIFHFANIKHVTNSILLVVIIFFVTLIIKKIIYNDKYINFKKSLAISVILLLLSLLILPIVSYIINTNITSVILKIEIIITIVLILLMNHNKIISKKNKCCDNMPNYPEDSLDLFMLFKNIVSEIFSILGVCSYNYSTIN